MKRLNTIVLLASIFIPSTSDAAIPWYALLGGTLSGARIVADPINPATTNWITRKLGWFDRPTSSQLSANLKELDRRLEAALKLMEEDYKSPERQAKYDKYTADYESNMKTLEQERKDGKRAYLSYVFKKGKIKDDYKNQLKTLEIDKLSPFWARVRFNFMRYDLWGSWWHCYMHSFNYRYNNISRFVTYAEDKLK
jgi:hypothetical protein